MHEVRDMDLTPEYVSDLAGHHTWAAGGVSDYPPRDPLVGQSRFFRGYRTFIRTIDQDQDRFTHVFAVEGEWGRGKSRLGHELIAQINDCSRGWYVRDDAGGLVEAALFDSPERRDEYLGLYLRYSQLASDVQSSDNWFSVGLYKALLPLATRRFDGSHQSRIAEQALRRLEPEGFDADHLAGLLEAAAGHTDETLYLDPSLATRLVQAAYDYLREFGIRYVLIVLDELETVAEAATFGLETDEQRHLDGHAIRLIGKAIKEEDPRAKLPWLRYVALCSPLLGQQLREIKSLTRRFELVQLEPNAFADVSDYVARLKADRKLAYDYPPGLVEAAYAMSGANFGWFNVVMANIDAVLGQRPAGRPLPETGEIIELVLAGSGRVASHVLDHNAIEGIDTRDQTLLALARRLLYGQLPVPLTACPPRMTELLAHKNEYSEPVASRYQRVFWERLDCRRALEEAKFRRDQDEWLYPGVDQGLDLNGLLANLRTFAVVEPDPRALLIPQTQSEFRHLVMLVYNHPAAELAADALWHKLIGSEQELPAEDATHIGPSVAMLLRLDLRYRRAQHNSMIFRDPALADTHETAMSAFEAACRKDQALRPRVRLTGLFRLLDRNWSYAEPPLPNTEGLVIQQAPRGRAGKGGILFCEGLKLHPDGQAWFAWVDSVDALQRLHRLARQRRGETGRLPVAAFTGSVGVTDYYDRGGFDDPPTRGRSDILLHYLNSSELDALERIGLIADLAPDGELALHEAQFTSRFRARLNGIREFAQRAIERWRRELTARGLIAWPLRPGGKLNAEDRELLFSAWKLFAIDQPALGGLHALTPDHGISAGAVAELFGRLCLSRQQIGLGYAKDEHAGLFLDLDNPGQAQARFPAFLARIADPSKRREWTLEQARADWFWGHLAGAGGLSAKSVFDDWMWWCARLELHKVADQAARAPRWIQVSRAELANNLREAENWLDGDDPDGYRETVKLLAQVFGDGEIRAKFAPKGAAPQGVDTVVALDDLAHAQALLDAVKHGEEALTAVDDLAVLSVRLPGLLRDRGEALRRIDGVRPRELPSISLDNLRMLELNARERSLYERVMQARAFAALVQRASAAIAAAVDGRIRDIDADAAAAAPFPRRLFTLSLETLRNILAGAVGDGADSETQREEAAAGSDTLRHFLRALELAKASDRLELLAREAGVDLRSGVERPMAEVDGYILTTFRNFKERWQQAREQCAAVGARIAEALRRLEPLPPDYADAVHPRELEGLAEQLRHLEDAFTGLDEQAEPYRERLRGDMRRGQFAAMRELPELLLKPLINSGAVIAGKVQRIENAISGYRDAKLLAFNRGLRRRVEPLLNAVGDGPVPLLGSDAVKDLSLHDLNVELDLKQRGLAARASRALAGTGVDLARWCDIAEDMLAGREPALGGDELKALVARGILRQRISFGADA
jgi:hypothetical protein